MKLTLFVAVNFIFALLFMFDPGGISNARPGNFADAFFFSVQTLGAGGGDMAPESLYADILVAIESFFGILTIALFAGIMFARFSRPLSRVVFSNVAVVAPFDGVPTLMFRTANQRGNSILDAAVTVSLARQHVTLEGVEMRRFQELKLLRSNNPLFALSWTIMHSIDETSPLFGLTPSQMAEQEMEIIVMLSGMDKPISDHIYARHAYWNDEIKWRQRFVDVISVAPTGHRVVDLAHFHDTRDANETMG
jgi:inward rectifier potassium channel